MKDHVNALVNRLNSKGVFSSEKAQDLAERKIQQEKIEMFKVSSDCSNERFFT